MKIDPNSHAGQVFLANGKLPAADPMTATDKKAVYEADDQVNTTKGTIQNLNQALEESKKAYSGFTAGARGYVGSLVGTEGGRATENLDNIVSTNAVSNLKAIFGGNPTEGERKILLELAGSSKKDQAVRDDIYKRAIEAAQRRQTYYEQRAKQLRGGDFYKPEGGAAPAGNGGWSVKRID